MDDKHADSCNWPSEDPKGFFFISEENDTEIDGESIPQDNIYGGGLTDFTDRIAAHKANPLA